MVSTQAREARISIRILPIVLIVAVVVIGFLAGRLALYRAADRVLDRWDAAGLPGSRPEGLGPTFSAAWPPRVRWDDVVWRGEEGTARCRRLEIGFDPQSILRRSLRLNRVRVEDLQIETAQLLPSWIDPVVETFPSPVIRSSNSDPPHPEAVRFECEGVCVASITSEVRRIEGWGWTQLPGRWRAVADVTTESGRGMRLSVEGAGIAGDEELVADVSLAEHRNARYLWRRPLGEAIHWRLTGRDDGSLLRAVFPLPAETVPAGLAGIIDFKVSGGPGSARAAEFQIHELSIARSAEPPWKVSGCLSLTEGVVSFEELRFEGGDASFVVSGEVGPDRPAVRGRWKLAGEFNGEPLDFDGVITQQSDLWTFRADRPKWGSARAGSVELVVSEDGWGGAADPPVLRAAGMPVSWLENWLPFTLPGRWTGSVDGYGTFRRAVTGWRATGRAELREVGITGLALVEDIGAILGGGQGDRAVRVDRMRMRWAAEAGELVADSLEFEGRTASVSGILLAVPPDSVFGVLRVAPSGDRVVGAILRLLGGDEAAIDLGISGSASQPALVPLDEKTRRRWLDEAGKIRDRFWR